MTVNGERCDQYVRYCVVAPDNVVDQNILIERDCRQHKATLRMIVSSCRKKCLLLQL